MNLLRGKFWSCSLPVLLFFGVVLSCTPRIAVPEPEVREEMDSDVEEWHGGNSEIRIATLEGAFTLGVPESSLGNLTADALRFRAAHELHRFVHLGFIPGEGLNGELEEGILTTSDMYRLVPDEQSLVILELGGNQILRLADEIARRGGAPVSGLRMGIRNGYAAGVLVNSEVVDSNRTYLLATTTAALEIGSSFRWLRDAEARVDVPICLRELLADHFRNTSSVQPLLDGRIRQL
ncbi:MAG: 5'-nucleotidase C-terminal domain-containing protein [Balneolaceae bacterium]